MMLVDQNHIHYTYALYSRLDQEIDYENGDVPLHLGRIADSMYEWEGKVAECLGLTQVDVKAIKAENPGKLELQS